MFTVEFDHDNIEIVVVDDNGNHEDLKVDAFDDIVYIRQWNEEFNCFNVIEVSPKQWEELLESMNSPEGAYIKR